MENVKELKNIIFSKLTGEGGLNSDFQPNAGCPTGRYEDKPDNMEMQQILARITNDEIFFDILASKIIAKYFELCKARNLPEGAYFDRVMTAHECCLWARFYGLQMLAKEQELNDVRGR